MKTQFTLLTALMLLTFIFTTNAQTYVDATATGNNDGTSWANAYTELATALDNYSEGDEIWVAAGTYLPQEPSAWPGDPRQMFYIHQDVALYGGFDGTETMLSERDPATNVTILSGDLNGDDVDDDFVANREDNALNVMVIDTFTTAATVIDGFTFEGGHADIDDDYFPNKRGGGIFTWGATQVRNCIFQQNYTIWHGGGIYFWQEGASGGRVENCIFRNNRCINSGGGLWASHILGEELVVENCQFDNNEAGFGGGGAQVQNSFASFNNCVFDNNEAEVGGGAQVINSFASFNNCQFTNNLAQFGGGLRLVYTELGPGGQSFTVTACDFQGNSADVTAGAIAYDVFENSADNSVTISNCQITKNTSANGGGFSYFSQGASNGNITIEACDFIGNQAISTAVDPTPQAAGLKFDYRITSTSQNDTIRVVDCLIQDNSAEEYTGGLLYVHYGGMDNHLLVDNCEFIGNNEDSGLTVGGMTVTEGGENTSVLVRNTLFDGNTGTLAQGFGLGADAAIAPPEEQQIELVNCLFINHNNTGPETAVVGTERELTLTNCTFSENQSVLLGTRGDGKIAIRNNIFQANGSPTYTATAIGSTTGLPIQSLGGNLISDDAMDDWLTSADQSNTDPLFEMGTFQPAANSPAVDAGVLLDEPSVTDYAGNARIQGSCIDIGAFESPHDGGVSDCLVFTSTREVISDQGLISIFPNPVSGTANISIDNKWTGELTLQIINTMGQVVHSADFDKFDQEVVLQFGVADLPTGVYRVLISNGASVVTSSFVRM